MKKVGDGRVEIDEDELRRRWLAGDKVNVIAGAFGVSGWLVKERAHELGLRREPGWHLRAARLEAQ